jgi:hypothetical protein
VGLLETIKVYNIIPYAYVESKSAMVMCNLFDGKLCDLVLSMATDSDPNIDQKGRYDVMMSNEPSGASYKNFIHYS